MLVITVIFHLTLLTSSMPRQFKVFSNFSTHWLSTELQAVKAPHQYMMLWMCPEMPCGIRKCMYNVDAQEDCISAILKARREMEGEREARKWISNLKRTQVSRAKAERTWETTRAHRPVSQLSLGSSAQAHPCQALCWNLTSFFLSLGLMVLIGKT